MQPGCRQEREQIHVGCRVPCLYLFFEPRLQLTTEVTSLGAPLPEFF